MTLYNLNEYYSGYCDEALSCFDVKNFSVHTEDELISFVTNILVDGDNGRFRYFVIDKGFWIFSASVLLPVGLASVDYDNKCISVPRLTKEQFNDLPEFQEDIVIDNHYEEQVRDVCRPLVTVTDLHPFYQAATYNYMLEPYFYEVSDRNLKMYEEHLMSRKNSFWRNRSMRRQKYAFLRNLMETA